METRNDTQGREQTDGQPNFLDPTAFAAFLAAVEFQFSPCRYMTELARP